MDEYTYRMYIYAGGRECQEQILGAKAKAGKTYMEILIPHTGAARVLSFSHSRDFTPTLAIPAECFPALPGSPVLAIPGQPVHRSNGPPDL